MPLVYMNSWASLALRASALVVFAVAALGGALDHSARTGLAATALLLAASAAHPLSVSLRLGGGAGPALLAVAEGVVALALAAMLGLAAASGTGGAVYVGALAAPLALVLAGVATAGGVAQHGLMRRSNGDGRWAALPVAIAAGSAGVALLAALQSDAAARAGVPGSPVLGTAALALALWITHSALRLRRARRTAARARLRDLALAYPVAASRQLQPAAQWS